MTRELTLYKGFVTLVDDDRFEYLSQWRWRLKNGVGGKKYVTRSIGNKQCLLHRVVMDAPDNMYVDHINGDTLDNRRSNLRLATPAQNSWNRGADRDAMSRYVGVARNTSRKRWRAQIHVNGRQLFLGTFDSEEEAARAFDAAARQYYGNFARLNFGEGTNG